MNVMKGLTKVIFALVASSWAIGCAAKPEIGRRNVVVNLDDSLKGMTSVQVDLIAVNATEKPAWQAKNVDDYWKANDPLRATPDKHMMLFQSERSRTLSKSDPIWDKWISKGGWDLFVVAFIPGVSGNETRKITLPLDKLRWSDPNADIKITAGDYGIRAVTSPQPEGTKKGIW